MAKAATLIITLFYLFGLSQPSFAEEKHYTPLEAFRVKEGATFPLDSLLTPTGEQIDSKKFLGKRLLINFYTVYCAPCIREVPKLNEIMRRNSDINVLAITPDSAGTAAEYVRKYHLNWPIAADARSLLLDTLNVEAFPAFALVDADGKLLATVLANQLGGEDGNATVEGIEKWLNAQSSERRSAAGSDAPIRFPIRSLTAADAASLVSNESEIFKDAELLAAQRPVVKREISGFKLEVFSADGGESTTSDIQYVRLPGGLEFMSHHVPATRTQTMLNESAIDVFGLTALVYWNSRFQYPNGVIAQSAQKMRLVDGRIFSADSPFILETEMYPGEAPVQKRCVPLERVAASEVHPALSGKATLYSCLMTDFPGMEERTWYLEDTARYIGREFIDEGTVSTRFKIIDVMFD